MKKFLLLSLIGLGFGATSLVFAAASQFDPYGNSSYGGGNVFGEVSTMGGAGDNVSCSCFRKYQSGDQTDTVCNQRVKEMVNAQIQRTQVNGTNSTVNNMFNSSAVH